MPSVPGKNQIIHPANSQGKPKAMLLLTKITCPPSRPNTVLRPTLLGKLDAGIGRKLILVAATAGFGKTTLVAQWAAQHPNAACWLALDPGDNDPSRFFSYLIAALQTQFPDFGQPLLATLQSPQPTPIAAMLPPLLNELAALPHPALLILDDYHLIDNLAIHDALTFLLEQLPPTLTLVLLTRTDPPLPLPRLRGRHQLVELRAEALRFSLTDTRQFFHETMHLPLPDHVLAALESRTEGWAVGLQLAAIALQNTTETAEAFVATFSGSHRFVLDYLLEEVLNQQPADVRQFLLQTAVLHQFTAELCDVVLGRGAGGQGSRGERVSSAPLLLRSPALLHHLETHNLFLIPLDSHRRWYRYHHLFADLLRARLQAESPQLVPMLQRRAAAWFEQNGRFEEAVAYVLAAADYDHAADLILGLANAVSQRNEIETLLRWQAQFPPGYVANHPRLAIYFGLAFALNGRWFHAQTLFAGVAPPNDLSNQPSDTLLLAYLIATHQQDRAQLIAIAAQAQTLPNPSPLTQLMQALITSLLEDFATAHEQMTATQHAAEQENNPELALTALFHRCRLLVFAGRLRQAHQLCQQAQAHIAALGATAAPLASFVYVSLGRIFLEWGALEDGEEALQTAVQISQQSGLVTGILASATMMLAELAQLRGDTTRATTLAAAALDYARQFDPPAEQRWLEATQAKLWLMQGQVVTAVRWLHNFKANYLPLSLFYTTDQLPPLEARVLLAQQQPDAVVALLAQEAAPSINTVERYLLLALARHAQGNSHHARLALVQAVELAAAENRRYPFLSLAPGLQPLLAQWCQQADAPPFAREMIEVVGKTAVSALPPLIAPLTPREQDVLQLLVAGQSNQEIAATLTLAPSTVKWYINTLYSKLQVQNRPEAIAKARTLGLFA